jgi:hypothetical protein
MKTEKTITLGELHRLKGNPTRNPLRIPPCTPMRTPYNTGKVKIGIHYVPPMLNRNTETTDFWQDLYLGGHRADKRERFWMAMYVAAMVVGSTIGYLYYLTY